MNNKYNFIHPTKTGGTSVEKFFNENYFHQINGGQGHAIRCGNNNKPIIIVRDPFSRFISMFMYWKYGATQGLFMRSKENHYIKDIELKEKMYNEFVKDDVYCAFDDRQDIIDLWKSFGITSFKVCL